jgi:CdiI immunity protein
MTKHGGKSEFAALREFVRGYLNQDFADEYGSAAGAAKAFCEDAAPAEVAVVAREWTGFVDAARGLKVDEINRRLVEELGSGWTISDPAELGDVAKVLGKSVK